MNLFSGIFLKYFFFPCDSDLVAGILVLDMQIQDQPLAFAPTFLLLMVVMYFVTLRLCIISAVNINCPKDGKVAEKIQRKIFGDAKK
jgi:hypothetical protein